MFFDVPKGKLALCREERIRIMEGERGVRPSTAPVSGKKSTKPKPKKTLPSETRTFARKSKLVGKKRLTKSGM